MVKLPSLVGDSILLKEHNDKNPNRSMKNMNSMKTTNMQHTPAMAAPARTLSLSPQSHPSSPYHAFHCCISVIMYYCCCCCIILLYCYCYCYFFVFICIFVIIVQCCCVLCCFIASIVIVAL